MAASVYHGSSFVPKSRCRPYGALILWGGHFTTEISPLRGFVKHTYCFGRNNAGHSGFSCTCSLTGRNAEGVVLFFTILFHPFGILDYMAVPSAIIISALRAYVSSSDATSLHHHRPRLGDRSSKQKIRRRLSFASCGS